MDQVCHRGIREKGTIGTWEACPLPSASGVPGAEESGQSTGGHPMYTSTPEQKAKAKERRERIQDLTRRIARMSEAERAALVHGLATTIEGHTLSMTNQMLIAYQSVGQQQVTIWLPCSTSLRLKRWGNETDKTAHVSDGRSCSSTRLYRSPGSVSPRVDGPSRDDG